MKNSLYIVLSIWLVACGGSSDSNTTPPPPLGDTTPPEINLIGPTTVYHEVGRVYTDQGADFSDDSGQQITTATDVDVDVTQLGTYTVTYSATDSAGNNARKTRTVEVVGASLIDYYTFTRDSLGVNRQDFKAHYRTGMEHSIYAQDALQRGDYATAKALVDEAFDSYPLYSNIWRQGAGDFGQNNGDPIGYYSLRMIDKITQVLPVETKGTLTITAVMVLCTNATRPINTNYDTENVYLELDDRMLADNYKVLKESIFLFELWMKAITQGLETSTEVHIQEECAETSFNVSNGGYQGSRILSSYANNREIIERVPSAVKQKTNVWLVITPSAVVGDGSDFPDYWVDGGMGLSNKGVPLMIATDKHFLRKYHLNGRGDYTEVERRVYQPQWFQHEIMHHLYRTWPEFQLELQGHDWFVRSFWPDDFVGRHEPDYYWETLEKRLNQASPSLSEGLSINEWQPLDINDVGFDALQGKWLEDVPFDDAYRYVEIIYENGQWYWTNAADRKWLLYEENGKLLCDTTDQYGNAYGIQTVLLSPDENGELGDIYFNGGRFTRTDWEYQPSAVEEHHTLDRAQKRHTVNSEESEFKVYHHNTLMRGSADGN
ncbi:MAG: DUF5011 domain-containing protein [Alteromonas sp.]